MDLSSHLAHRLSTQSRDILSDAPEVSSSSSEVGVMLTVDTLVRECNSQNLVIDDDSTSDIEMGFIDLLVEPDSMSIPTEIASADVNHLMNKVTSVAAANGVRCHFILRCHISYEPKEQ
jgi:hypothetical protein